MLPLILSLCIFKKSLASPYLWPSLGGGKEQQGLPQLSLLWLPQPPFTPPPQIPRRAQFISDSPLDLGDPKLSMTFQILLCEHQLSGGGKQEDLVPDDFTWSHLLKSWNTCKMLQLNLLFLKPVFFPSPYTRNMAKNYNWKKYESWYLRVPVAKDKCMWHEKAHNTRVILFPDFLFLNRCKKQNNIWTMVRYTEWH